jgi:hypothetical protein
MATKPQDNSPQGNAARENIAKQQREHRRRRRGNGDVADWTVADAMLMHRAICAVTGCDCAIQLGYTKDGGSMVVRIVGDGDPYNEFIRPTEDVNAFLESLISDFQK